MPCLPAQARLAWQQSIAPGVQSCVLQRARGLRARRRADGGERDGGAPLRVVFVGDSHVRQLFVHAASLMGGTLSTVSTLPLDVLVAKSQDAKKAGQSVSAWGMFRAELDEKGWKALGDSYMMGFEARLAHVCFTTVVMKTGAPLMYDYLFGGK